MTAALLSLLVAAQTAGDVQLGTVDVSGRQVEVTVPQEKGPFDDSTPHVTIDGWKYQVLPGFGIGVRYKSDGGWGEVAEGFPAAQAKSASAPEYRVKVFILTAGAVLEQRADGNWAERRGYIGQHDVDAIYDSLAQFKAMAETASGGAVRVTFDVTVDDTTLFRTARHGSMEEYRPSETEYVPFTVGHRPAPRGLLGPDFVYDDIAPRINNDKFANIEGPYSGPYSSVFVVHSLPVWDVSSYLIDRTPVTTISWPTFTARKVGPALSIQFFYAWLQHLGIAARAHGHMLGYTGAMPSGGALPTEPHVYATSLTPDLLKFGNHLQSPDFVDAVQPNELPWRPRTGAMNERIEKMADGTYAVDAPFAALFQKTTGAKPVGRTLGADGEWDATVFEGNVVQKDPLAMIGLAPNTVPAATIVGDAAQPGVIAFAPHGTGDFSVSMIDDSVVGKAVAITERSVHRRGHATLAGSVDGGTLFTAKKGTGLTFRVSCDLTDPFVLRLVTRDGHSHDVQLFGTTRVPAEIEDAPEVLDLSRSPGPYWTGFNVPLDFIDGEQVVEVQIAAPRYAQYYERKDISDKSFKVGSITFGPMTNPDKASSHEVNADIAWANSLDGALNDDAKQRIRNMLTSEVLDVRLAALGALNHIKEPDLVLDIGARTISDRPGEAYLAVSALRLLNIDHAWSQIAFTAIKGPMGFNYQFAAEALADKQEDPTIDVLSTAMLNRSWRARRAAVRAMDDIQSDKAAVMSAAT
ncbi:MAG TPA: hypothetical protein VNI20_11745, partial [Fimbriimonadaceae bacterium]|nr:hypothetical protein [Fimbriimonadaceae bacterium]